MRRRNFDKAASTRDGILFASDDCMTLTLEPCPPRRRSGSPATGAPKRGLARNVGLYHRFRSGLNERAGRLAPQRDPSLASPQNLAAELTGFAPLSPS